MQVINVKPICELVDGRLVCYKNGQLLFYLGSPLKLENRVNLRLGIKESILGRLKLLYRFFRLGIRSALQIDDSTLLFFVNERFYEYDISSGKLLGWWMPEHGIRALYMTKISGISGFSDMIVFGGYLSNFKKRPVSIYKRVGTNKWDPIYTFSVGSINHIHNIIPDKYNKCVWIFTGDFGTAANIWIATNNFESVLPVSNGSQTFRGCIGFPTINGLIYATDSPFERNSVRLLHYENGAWKSECIADINGSCIYGTKVGGDIIISSTVEPDNRGKSFITSILNNKPGGGIKDRCVYIYKIDESLNCDEILSVEKDFLPPVLFQFGAIMFPSGSIIEKKVIAYCIATKMYDCKTIVIDILE